VNEYVVSVDRHKKVPISLHMSADVCNEMGNFFVAFFGEAGMFLLSLT
jgi:hypothetical protein